MMAIFHEVQMEFSKTSLLRTSLGPQYTVLYMEYSYFRGFKCTHVNAKDDKWGRTVVFC